MLDNDIICKTTVAVQSSADKIIKLLIEVLNAPVNLSSFSCSATGNNRIGYIPALPVAVFLRIIRNAETVERNTIKRRQV